MRLMNVETFKLEEFSHDAVPTYAILSHTWGKDNEEVSFRDVQQGKFEEAETRPIKIGGCCKQAKEDGHRYIWIDTCCIDKANSVELHEAINSMFQWYRSASICYAYLSDVPADDIPRDPGSKFMSSRWFTRGWTLQELLASKNLRFYDSEWHCLGSKGEMCTMVESITGIPRPFLLGIAELHDASVAQRMSWAARRVTKRNEDTAYCLLGIFGVTMPMIYGEGNKAFRRLQEEIMKDIGDDSILAWGLDRTNPTHDTSIEVPAEFWRLPRRTLRIAARLFHENDLPTTYLIYLLVVSEHISLSAQRHPVSHMAYLIVGQSITQNKLLQSPWSISFQLTYPTNTLGRKDIVQSCFRRKHRKVYPSLFTFIESPPAEDAQ